MLVRRSGFVLACALVAALLFMLYTHADQLYVNLKTPALPLEDRALEDYALKDLATSPPAVPLADEPLPAAPNTTLLSIATDPGNATIFIDGDSVGVSPLFMHALPSGVHLLSIEKEDHVALDTLLVLSDGQLGMSFALRERRQAPRPAGDTPPPAQALAGASDAPARVDDTPPPNTAQAPPEEAAPALKTPPAGQNDALARKGSRRVSIPFKWQSEAYAFMAAKVFTAPRAAPADDTPRPNIAHAPREEDTPAAPAPADDTPLPGIAQAPREEDTPALKTPPPARNDALDGPKHVSIPFEWQNEALAFLVSEGIPIVFDRPSAVPAPADDTPLPNIAHAPPEEAAPGPENDRPGPSGLRKAPPKGAAPRIEVGELRVASEPPGASVWLNDRLLGETPLLIRQVEAAPQQITLRLSGYEDLHKNVVVMPRQTSIVNGQFKQLSGAYPPWWTFKELSRLAKRRKTSLLAALYGKRTLQVGEAENYRVRRVNGAVLPVEYYWDFGDGTFAEGNNVAHRYRKAGQYTLKVLVRNIQGIDADSMLITVTAPQLADREERTVTIARAPAAPARNAPAGLEAGTPTRKTTAPPARLASLHAPESMIWPRTGYTWVVVTHFHRNAAERDKRHFREEGYRTGIIVDDSGQGSTVYRVVMGRFSTPEEAARARPMLPPDIPGGVWLQDLADVSVE